MLHNEISAEEFRLRFPHRFPAPPKNDPIPANNTDLDALKAELAKLRAEVAALSVHEGKEDAKPDMTAMVYRDGKGRIKLFRLGNITAKVVRNDDGKMTNINLTQTI